MAWKWGIIFAGFAVMLGAFGAHGLESAMPNADLSPWKTAVTYQMWHALALLAIGLHPKQPRLPALLFVFGILIFSGSLYTLVLTQTMWLGAITPIGGASLIAGWVALLYTSR